MSKIVSRRPRVSPLARIAWNGEPYSTSRCSPRFHQTRCGIPCTSGWAPVAIAERQTGVSEGKVETARRYSPSRASAASAGARPDSTAASKAWGVRPSITIRITLRVTGSVAREDAQPRVPLPAARAQARAERRQGQSLEVAEHRHEGQRRDQDRRAADEQRRPAARAAPAERARDDLHRAADAAGCAE